MMHGLSTALVYILDLCKYSSSLLKGLTVFLWDRSWKERESPGVQGEQRRECFLLAGCARGLSLRGTVRTRS